jgi:acyl carrier protein phosphodiesterase
VNFLAHAYLSGGSKDLVIGNFIADAIRGKDYEAYREGIIKGILLHRKIDTYTDQHPIVSRTKARLRPFFSKYSSVVSDIYYDHFLAFNWKEYSTEPLKEFTENIYTIIRSEFDTMPEEVKYFFPYMEKNNWLYNYQSFYGMEQAFKGMSKRAKFDSKMEKGVEVLKDNYQFFEEDFKLFFPELNEYVLSIRD